MTDNHTFYYQIEIVITKLSTKIIIIIIIISSRSSCSSCSNSCSCILILLTRFSHQCDSKSFQLSSTLLSILAGHNNVLVWMVSARPPISNSFNPQTKPKEIVPIPDYFVCLILQD